MVKGIITHNRGGFINGLFLVDDEDYEMLSNYYWNLNAYGYAQTNIKIDGKYTTKRLHQMILNVPKGMQVDHIDHNIYNNLKINLRPATMSQQAINRIPYSNGTSKYKGVCFQKSNNKWRADIKINQKRYYLGVFIKEKDAARAYNEKAIELFDDIIILNEID